MFDKNVVHNPVNETDPMADKKNENPAVTLAWNYAPFWQLQNVQGQDDLAAELTGLDGTEVG